MSHLAEWKCNTYRIYHYRHRIKMPALTNLRELNQTNSLSGNRIKRNWIIWAAGSAFGNP